MANGVAVGTTIADRPPDRSVRARLRTRLLPRMSGGEADMGTGMQNVGLRNPPVQDGEQTPPAHLGALTATNQNIPPQSASAPPEDAQLSRVPWDSVILVITQHHLPKPCASLAGRVMLPALKFNLEGFQLRNHPLLGRNPPDGENSGVSGAPTEVGEAQKRKGLRFPLATPLSVFGGEPPELDQSCLAQESRQRRCDCRPLRG